MRKAIYLDYAAATPIDPRVLTAMKPYLQEVFYNPSAQYLAAKDVAKTISSARATIAKQLGARPTEIIFTAGGTEANNLAIKGLMDSFPAANLVVSAIEHEAILAPSKQYNMRLVKVDQDGIIDLDSLDKCIDDDTVLVSVMYANNEIGTIQPLKQVARRLDSIRKSRRKKGNPLPIYLHADACQAAAWLDLHADSLGVDMMTINAGKIYGPKQCGALFVKSGIKLVPQMLGGGQEGGQRSGTENVAGIVGFAKALQLVQEVRPKEFARMQDLQTLFFAELQVALPEIIINGSLKHRLPNNVHITIPGKDNERLMMQLDELGVQCAVGSACSASNDEPSHVLKAIGLSDESAQSSLRFSMGNATTKKDILTTVKTLRAIVRA